MAAVRSGGNLLKPAKLRSVDPPLPRYAGVPPFPDRCICSPESIQIAGWQVAERLHGFLRRCAARALRPFRADVGGDESTCSPATMARRLRCDLMPHANHEVASGAAGCDGVNRLLSPCNSRMHT